MVFGVLAARAGARVMARGETDQMATDFQEIIRHRQSDKLDAWLARCHELQLGAFARFADSLTKDYAAVAAALAINWSNW